MSSHDFASLRERASILDADITRAHRAGDLEEVVRLMTELANVKDALAPHLAREERHIDPEAIRRRKAP